MLDVLGCKSRFTRRASFVVVPFVSLFFAAVFPVCSSLRHLHVVQLDLCLVAKFSSMSTGLCFG